MANKIKTFKLGGGEDFVTSDLELAIPELEGMARYAENFEQDYNSGYTKMAGFRPYLGTGTVPGLTAMPILGLFAFSGFYYAIRAKDAIGNLGLYRLHPAVYEDDGSIKVGYDGFTIEITDIKDSTGAATTLTGDGINGVVQTVIHNFKATGSTSSSGGTYPFLDISEDAGEVYGACGNNQAWHFDGTTLQYINSTYTPDQPRHIEASGNRLMLGFRGGEIALSALGDPTDFNPVSGAGSIGVTDWLTGMNAAPDGTVYIYTKDKTYILFNISGPIANLEMKKHSKDVGGEPYTTQILGDKALAWDEYGLTELNASDLFGNIVSNSISNQVQYRFENKRPRCSAVLRNKSQYRVYLINESTSSETAYYTQALIATLIKGGSLGITHATFPFVAYVCHHAVVKDGMGFGDLKNAHLMGTDNGTVYIMDEGTTYDGVAFTSILTLPFHHTGSPGYQKKYRKISLNVDAEEQTTIQFTAEFSYGRDGDSKDVILDPAGALWGTKSWGDFVWGGGSVGHIEAYINGHGENVSVTINSTGDDIRQYTLKDISYTYEVKRINH